jgi:hypothetical protein
MDILRQQRHHLPSLQQLMEQPEWAAAMPGQASWYLSLSWIYIRGISAEDDWMDSRVAARESDTSNPGAPREPLLYLFSARRTNR